MRSLLLLAAVCCLVLSACGSPIARPEDDKEVEVGRQAANAQAPAAPATDDDDDDEEDDDEDDPISGAFGDDDDDDEDDDDDDEEADDDDEGGDVYDFLDGILGGDEDDEDDDEEKPEKPVAPVVEAVAAAPAATPAEEVAEAAAEESEAADVEATEEAEPEAGQKEPSSAEVEAPAAAAVTPEDDDDEEDPIDELTPEDDEDDDEEEEDDDDDDEDEEGEDLFGRNNSEKHSRALTEPAKKQASVPAIYIVKYNKFVDTILDKMNDILRQSYDPVSVKLQPIDASKKSSKPKKNKSKSKRKSSNKKKNAARGEIKESTTTSNIPAALMEENPKINEVKTDSLVEQTQISESRAIKEKENSKAKPTATNTRTTKKPPTKTQKPKPKPPTKVTTKLTTKKPTTTKNKTKTSTKSKPRAKGTLYGLSSLRRTGDVAVNIMTNHTTVKSNFAVGPLILKVEKVVGRGAKKEVKSATATTAEMTGKLSLRINNEGVATLHSIKVLQPKQVRVDSNHERTRELVWRRSARIAHVVSEKLLTASKPMFHYQPIVKQ